MLERSEWRQLATDDSMTVYLETTTVRPSRDSTVLLQLRYDYARPQGRERAAELRLQDRASLPADLRFRRLETVEYGACAPGYQSVGLLQASFIDAEGAVLARRFVDTRDPRGFPSIGGDRVARVICDLLARGEVRIGDPLPVY